ncbi:hypothetical protein [Xylanimonas sp. McL0601]|uniref:hypothetical protein n=1 Tax=Xylanimonas sp. McL0601 TaxID=3414739 RepID=UPI003CE73BA5
MSRQSRPKVKLRSTNEGKSEAFRRYALSVDLSGNGVQTAVPEVQGKPWWATVEGRAAYEAERQGTVQGDTRGPLTGDDSAGVLQGQTPRDSASDRRLCLSCGADLDAVDALSVNPNGERVTCSNRCRQKLYRRRRA